MSSLKKILESIKNIYAKITNLENKTEDSDWIEATLNDGVVNNALASKGNVRYRKCGKLVQIIGSVKGITQSTAIFTLPDGFRPIARVDNITAQSGTRWFRIFVSPAGTVQVETSSDDYNADRWIALDCMFLVD